MDTPEGELAWVGLTLYIVCYDIWAARTGNETLSSAFYAALKHPVRRWPTTLVWSYITAHLFHLIPAKYDPLRCPWKEYHEKLLALRR